LRGTEGATEMIEVLAVLIVILSALYGLVNIAADLGDILLDHKIPDRWRW
jgi:hypothetical protein